MLHRVGVSRFVALQHVELRLSNFALQYGSRTTLVEIGSWADLIVHPVQQFQSTSGGERVCPQKVDDDVPSRQILGLGPWLKAQV